MNDHKVPSLRLNDDHSIPQLGLGVWQASDQEAEQAVTWALDAGYRLIDTAAVYGNEEGVGRAIAGSSVARSELFVTTKLWNADQGYNETLQAFDTSMKKLGLDYLDLYLIHWPVPKLDRYVDTWRAFEKLQADGRIRSIGVSNFQPRHLEKLLSEANVIPALNQIELHPYLQQAETRGVCLQNRIQIESWSPIGGSKSNLLEDPLLTELATTYRKSPAQIVIRWHIQNGFVVIPKSVHQDRIIENISVFDFELSPADMARIHQLNKDQRFGPDPANANFT